MIKFAIQFLINLTLILPMFSQVTWFPPGAKWHYEYGSWGNQGITILEVLNEDTLIGNNYWKRILSTTLYEENDSLHAYDEILYVYQNNQRVVGFDQWGTYLLYDFNADVGDTLDMSFGGWSPYPFIVDSIGLKDINGSHLKFQIIRFPSLFEPGEFDQMEVIEGIGSTYSHFFHNRTILQPFDFPTYYFRCYEDENIGLVNLYFPNIDCDYIPGVSAIEPVAKNAVIIYPNPAKDALHVDSKSQVYEDLLIVDLLGSIKVTMNDSTQEIDISQLEAGVYFVIGKDKMGQILFREKFCKFNE